MKILHHLLLIGLFFNFISCGSDGMLEDPQTPDDTAEEMAEDDAPMEEEEMMEEEMEEGQMEEEEMMEEEDMEETVAIDFTGQTPPNPPEGMEWVLVESLSDEFDAWDADKWFKPLWNYGVPVQMVAENSGVSDGNLWIKATEDSGAERWFNTSRVQSRAQINFPMYTVSRIKTAHISAFNTFWLNNGDSANRNEIDIIENNSKPSCDCQPDFPWQMNSQYFHVVDNDTKRNHGNFDNRNLSDENPLKGVRWNEEYHTVGVWWQDATHIQFYLDGEPAGSVVSEREFTRELNIIWDLWTLDAPWLGGLSARDDLSDDSLNTMKIDWVHTYTLVEQ